MCARGLPRNLGEASIRTTVYGAVGYFAWRGLQSLSRANVSLRDGNRAGVTAVVEQYRQVIERAGERMPVGTNARLRSLLDAVWGGIDYERGGGLGKQFRKAVGRWGICVAAIRLQGQRESCPLRTGDLMRGAVQCRRGDGVKKQRVACCVRWWARMRAALAFGG